MIHGWGNVGGIDAEIIPMHAGEPPARVLAGNAPLIARGLGRSYGDSALAPRVLDTRDCRRVLEFDEQQGLLVAEAGLSLAQIVAQWAPRGWFLPVTPGTRHVTLGGAVAADVHGKNHHHDGSFSEHVAWLRLMLADGSVLRCSSTENRELFLATAGGMGLTGVILEVALQMRPIQGRWIRQRVRRHADLASLMGAFEHSQQPAYTVAWLDCSTPRRAGRGIVFDGEHAGARYTAMAGTPPRRRQMNVPVFMPNWLLNGYSARAFNSLYYLRAREGDTLVPLERFFYPLDTLGHWNRLYGRRGFVQYQCVVPSGAGAAGVRALVEAIAASGEPSLLAVLKLFGPGNEAYLSFPREGWTLAVDFPATPGVFDLLKRLDAMVLEQGGRLYLSKDVRMDRRTFEAGYPALEQFLAVKERVDPHHRFASLQSQRLGLT